VPAKLARADPETWGYFHAQKIDSLLLSKTDIRDYHNDYAIYGRPAESYIAHVLGVGLYEIDIKTGNAYKIKYLITAYNEHADNKLFQDAIQYLFKLVFSTPLHNNSIEELGNFRDVVLFTENLKIEVPPWLWRQAWLSTASRLGAFVSNWCQDVPTDLFQQYTEDFCRFFCATDDPSSVQEFFDDQRKLRTDHWSEIPGSLFWALFSEAQVVN
jgi:hypothetical protein